MGGGSWSLPILVASWCCCLVFFAQHIKASSSSSSWYVEIGGEPALQGWTALQQRVDPDQLVPRIYRALSGLVLRRSADHDIGGSVVNNQGVPQGGGAGPQGGGAAPQGGGDGPQGGGAAPQGGHSLSLGGPAGTPESKGNLQPTKRLSNVRERIKRDIPVAIQTIRQDMVIRNRDKVILAFSNFLGMIYGCLMASRGNFLFTSFNFGQYLSLNAQLLYGYGYWGPFILELEQPRLPCGLRDYEEADKEYEFLEEPAGTSTAHPSVLAFYIRERSNRLKKSIYCILNQKRTNDDAKRIDALISQEATLMTEILNAAATKKQASSARQ